MNSISFTLLLSGEDLIEITENEHIEKEVRYEGQCQGEQDSDDINSE
jgi:hypothetical protein